jgi:hypothetical protein
MSQDEKATSAAEPSPNEVASENRQASAKSRSGTKGSRTNRSRDSQRSAGTPPSEADRNGAVVSEMTTRSETSAAAEPDATPESGTTPGADAEYAGIDLSSEVQRAEALLDEVGHHTGRRLRELGRALLRTAARAREEAEDIWAEAASIRRGR